MPIEIKDSDGGLGNIITTWGIVKEEELFDAFQDHLTQDDSKFKRYKYSLTDHTAAAEISFSNQKVEQLAKLCRAAGKINPDAIVAVVASQNLIYGLSRMWEMLSYESGWEIMIYRDRDDAESWIKKQVKNKFEIDGLAFG